MEQRDLRAIIWWEQKKGTSAAETHRQLVQVLGDGAPSYRTVANLHQHFRLGRETSSDLPRSGRPQEVNIPQLSARVSELVQADRRVSVRRIADETGEAATTIWRIVHEELRMNKLATRWVPRFLTPTQKADRAETCRENLALLQEERAEFLDSIVTGDESWCYHYDPLNPQEAREWTEQGQQPSGKTKASRSAGKMMLTAFFYRRGLLMADFLPRGQTINGNYYATLLLRLREEIKSKRRGRLTRGIRLLHDNASVHTCNVAQAAIAECGFQPINHPAYSPDVAPSDYFLFSDLKRHLRGKHFDCDESLSAAILEHFDSHSVAFWHEAIDSLENRWQRVVESHGEYID